jgi:hypothetical protein
VVVVGLFDDDHDHGARSVGLCVHSGLASVIGIGPEDLLEDGRIEDAQAPNLEWLRRRGLEPGGDVRGHRTEALLQHAGQEAGLALADPLLESLLDCDRRGGGRH